MHTTILLLNLAAALASTAWAVAALARPAILSGSNCVERGETFYARMYAVRAIPFGLVVGFLPLALEGEAVMWFLFTAAAVQISDVVIALGKKDPPMAAGAAIGATVHLLCGLAVN